MRRAIPLPRPAPMSHRSSSTHPVFRPSSMPLRLRLQLDRKYHFPILGHWTIPIATPTRTRTRSSARLCCKFGLGNARRLDAGRLGQGQIQTQTQTRLPEHNCRGEIERNTTRVEGRFYSIMARMYITLWITVLPYESWARPAEIRVDWYHRCFAEVLHHPGLIVVLCRHHLSRRPARAHG